MMPFSVAALCAYNGQAADTKHDEFPMKIKYALMSSNSDPEYLDFWPVAAEAWLNLGITPVLFYIPDRVKDVPVVPREVAGAEVHTVPLLPDVNIVLQASLLRYWGSCKYPDDAVIVSDIDLLPLSRRFFVDQLTAIDDDCYVHLKCVADKYESYDLRNIPGEKVTDISNMRFLNACYHAANGALMSEVLWPSNGGGRDWESDCKRAVPYHYVRASVTGGAYIITDRYVRRGKLLPRFNARGDELYMSARAHLFPRQDVFRFITHECDFLNRGRWYYKPERLLREQYSAAHLPRPYRRHKSAIDALMQRRPLSLFYRILFRGTERIYKLRWRAPERGVFFSYPALWAGEVAFGVMYRCSGWSGAELLRMYCRTQRLWTRRDNARLAGLYVRYKRCKKAICRLWS